MDENINEQLEDETFDEDDDSEEYEVEEESEERETDSDENIDEDEELEYDEEGNVIIPEDTEETDGDEASDTTSNAPREQEKAPETKDRKDIEIDRLRKELRRRDFQIKDTLKALGEDEESGIEGLERLAAEASDSTLEEYRSERDERQNKAEAEHAEKAERFEAKKRADLAAIQAEYPDAKNYKRIEDLPNFVRFAQLRDLGMTPEEAYAASHRKSIVTNAVSSTKQRLINLQNKDHLQSSMPKPAKDTSIKISKTKLNDLRELFPNKSDKEIIKLYKRTI
jgi:hypothetical protein